MKTVPWMYQLRKLWAFGEVVVASKWKLEPTSYMSLGLFNPFGERALRQAAIRSQSCDALMQ